MKKSLIRLKESSYEIVDIKIKKNRINLLDIEIFDKREEFLNKLNRKKDVYITFLPSEIIKKDISISSTIKNSSTIEKIIEFNLKKDFNEDLVFKYEFKERNEVLNQNIYLVEAIKKDELSKKIENIKDKSKIKLITTDYHSLFSISSKILNNENFISLYIENNHIIYIAGVDNNLIFFRESQIYFDNPLLKSESLASDITRTILFIKQQNRNINFKHLLISGDVVENSFLFENLINLDLYISVPFNSFISNIIQKDFVKEFLLLGVNFVEKKFNFEPFEIKSEKQYKIIKTLFLFLLFLPIIYFGYFNIINYLEIKEKENILKEKREYISYLEKNLKVLDLKRLEFFLNYFDNKNLSLEKEILSDLSILSPFFKLILPTKLEANEQEIKLNFQKKYPTLKKITFLKKEFEKISKNINKNKNLVSKIELNFENLEFKAILVLKRGKK